MYSTYCLQSISYYFAVNVTAGHRHALVKGRCCTRKRLPRVMLLLSIHTYGNCLQDLFNSICSVSLTVISLLHNPKKNQEMLLRHMHSGQWMLREVNWINVNEPALMLGEILLQTDTLETLGFFRKMKHIYFAWAWTGHPEDKKILFKPCTGNRVKHIPSRQHTMNHPM